jgi:sec-independent protein translocase protein TatB
MLDGFGFFEMLLVLIIGLVVLGPERLPVAIRTISGWINGIKRTANSVKTELEQELKIEKLQTDLQKAESLGLKDLDPELQKSIEQLREAARSVNRPYDITKPEAESETKPTVSPDATSDTKSKE